MIYPPGIKPGLSSLNARLMLVSHFSFKEKYVSKLEFPKGLEVGGGSHLAQVKGGMSWRFSVFLSKLSKN